MESNDSKSDQKQSSRFGFRWFLGLGVYYVLSTILLISRWQEVTASPEAYLYDLIFVLFFPWALYCFYLIVKRNFFPDMDLPESPPVPSSDAGSELAATVDLGLLRNISFASNGLGQISLIETDKIFVAAYGHLHAAPINTSVVLHRDKESDFIKFDFGGLTQTLQVVSPDVLNAALLGHAQLDATSDFKL